MVSRNGTGMIFLIALLEGIGGRAKLLYRHLADGSAQISAVPYDSPDARDAVSSVYVRPDQQEVTIIDHDAILPDRSVLETGIETVRLYAQTISVHPFPDLKFMLGFSRLFSVACSSLSPMQEVNPGL